MLLLSSREDVLLPEVKQWIDLKAGEALAHMRGDFDPSELRNWMKASGIPKRYRDAVAQRALKLWAQSQPLAQKAK